MDQQYQRIKVLVETDERSFRGYVYKPVGDSEAARLSDFLNTYSDKFLRLADVEVADRGHHYRVGDKQEFVAISVASIVYIAPIDGE